MRNELPANATDAEFCTRCGQSHAARDHAGCAAALKLEPARYCPHCARRMVVQVTPGGWSARCSEHGSISSN